MKKQVVVFAALMFCGSAQQAQTSTDCLVAQYYFNQGNANDDIGPYHGNAVGATLVPDRFGNPNAAYYLSGAPGSYINLGTTSVLKPTSGSISMWVNIADTVTAGSGYYINPILLTKCQQGPSCYEAYCIYYDISSSKVVAACTQLPCTQPSALTNSTVNAGLWHHYILAYDSTAIKLYLDGVLQDSVAKGFSSFFLAGDSVMIGNSASVSNNRFFNGTVDDIRFYNCVLSSAQVTGLYNEASPSIGINDPGSTVKKITVFPNPAEKIINFSETADVMITDTRGREITAGQNTNWTDISLLAPGIYLVTLSKKHVITGRGKFIKE
ncbi:MAG: T9SS type A sorting domain-containing protein [Bacteroidia bacterium]|nr:T9SS type A sorting domain-containing protein [Bacteroidia bacterium]